MGTCECRTTLGFRQIGLSCERCLKGCASCVSSTSDCSACRPNYQDFPNCVCKTTDGYHESYWPVDGVAKKCVPCTSSGCHSCVDDIDICSGCRENYVLIANTCQCLVDQGFREDMSSAPSSCKPCANPGCHSCAVDENICSGCRLNFVDVSGSCTCQLNNGFYLLTGIAIDQQGFQREFSSCNICHASCLSCNDGGQNSCTSCIAGYQFSGGNPGPCVQSNTLPVDQTALKFALRKSFTKENIYLEENNSFEISFSHSKGLDLATDFIEKNIFDLDLFTIAPAESIESSLITRSGPLKLTAQLNFRTEAIGRSLRVEFTPNPSKFTNRFRILDETHGIEITPAPKINQDDLESAKSKGETVSTLNQYSGRLSQLASFGLAFLNFDMSGNFMKLSQMNKIFCRFRMLDVNYGAYLWSYFSWSSEKFDPPSKMSPDDLVLKASKYYGNFLRLQIALHVFEGFLIETILYSLSWVLKIITSSILLHSANSQKIHKWQCYFIHISQKVHMVCFNLVAIDLLPYGLIAIFHTRDLSPLVFFASILLLTLLIVDFVQIWYLGGKALVWEAKLDQIKANIDTLYPHGLQNSTNQPIFKSIQREQAPHIFNTGGLENFLLKQSGSFNLGEKTDPTKNSFHPNNQETKILDEKAMVAKLSQNMSVRQFCTESLRSKKEFSNRRLLLMSNFSFLLRLSAMQVILVGLALVPIPALITLITIEITYSVSTISFYSKHQHLKSFFLVVPKIGQSLALLFVEILILASYRGLQVPRFHLSESSQKLIINAIFYSNLVEYGFMALHIFLIIRFMLSERKRKRTDPEYKSQIEKQQQFLIFIDPTFQRSQFVSTNLDDRGSLLPKRNPGPSEELLLKSNNIRRRKFNQVQPKDARQSMDPFEKIPKKKINKKKSPTEMARGENSTPLEFDQQKLQKKLKKRLQKKQDQEAIIREQGAKKNLNIAEREGQVDVSLAKRPKLRSRRSNQLKEKSHKPE